MGSLSGLVIQSERSRRAVGYGRTIRGLLFAVVLLVGLVVLTIIFPRGAKESSSELLSRARQVAIEKEYTEAEQLALQVPQQDPSWAQSRLLAGEYAMKAEQFDRAIEHFRTIPRDGSDDAVLAAYSLAEVCRHVGLLTEAEDAYRYVLRQQPDHVAAHSRLAFLLGATGQRWEALPDYFALVRLGDWSLEELVLLADLERAQEQGEYLLQCEQYAPDDLLVNLGLAAYAIIEKDVSNARLRLQEVVARDSQRLSAQALLGELLRLEDDSVFEEWVSQLPPSALTHPEIWYVRGLRFRKSEQLKAAARCFWEAIRLEPNHRRANYQLGQVLIALDLEGGQSFIQRADLIFELTQMLDQVLKSRGQNIKALERVAEILLETGRHWEAWAWATTASRGFPEAEWASQMIDELSPGLTASVPRTLPQGDLTLQFDFSEFELPKRTANHTLASQGSQPARRVNARVTFEDQALESGIHFTYFNGDNDLEKPGARMFEQNGGGVAVLDFDLDHWPDLFFSQGSPWKEGEHIPSADSNYSNKIFRNQAGKRFAEVTEKSGLSELGYGQGAAVGDFDNDGFSDLYVANIGSNRLYRNNGDGTFSDVSDEVGIKLKEWTASCLLVDLNGDAYPDLFDVNYLEGRDVFTIRCRGQACSPGVFQGAPDRCWINRADGTFSPLPNETPADEPKGLGAVSFLTEESHLPSIFISNDQVPNFYLTTRQIEEWPGVYLEEEALLRGLAYNEDGLATACMGIAVGDADQNGLLDLFVTNFQDEMNTLYLQDTPGLFVDSTRIAGLASPSLPYVGWGTQFIDVQLDGLPDLVVANGHVEDYRAEGKQYRMPPQLYLNKGHARFVDSDPADAGSYFQQKYLGRGLSRLDWNADGRMDFAVCNINQNASLATNLTAPVGHFLNVGLIATRSSRDAIGAEVRVTANGFSWVQQLTAGDGYMASNQRQLQFGLGDIETISRIQITWPSGHQQVLTNLPVDVTLDLVENLELGLLWRNNEPESLRVDP